MKTAFRVIAVALTALLTFASSARAQVEVEVVLNQEQYLPGENFPARVKIINHSGQTLHFGRTNWLSFNIDTHDATVMHREADIAFPEEFDVKPSEAVTIKEEYAPLFNLSNPGRYSINTTVRIAEWSKEVTSQARFFDVVRGVVLSDQEFGVPAAAGDSASAVPEVRHYILLQGTQLKRINLYLKITDASGTVTLKVRRLGQMISFSNPVAQLDYHNNLHILYHEGSRQYRYLVVNPDGDVIIRQTWGYTDTVPHMVADASGNISLEGGARLVAENDFPPTPKLSLPPATPASGSTNDVSLAKP